MEDIHLSNTSDQADVSDFEFRKKKQTKKTVV